MFFYISNAKKEKNKSNLDKIQLNLRILSYEEKNCLIIYQLVK